MEINLKDGSIRAYDKECRGCIKSNADIMLSFNQHKSGEITDLFLTQEQAEFLLEELGRKIATNKKINMKNITITLGEQEAQLISRALDFYCRMGLGQFNHLTDNHTIQKELWKDDSGQKQEDFQNAVKTLKRVYGLAPNASHDIFNTEHVGDDCRIAAHLHQAIRHEFYKADKDENKPKYTVNAYPADICELAKMEVPNFKIEIK